MNGRTTRERGARHGFTLLEMLMVIAIIATLAGMLVVMLADAQQESNRERTRSQIRRIDAIVLDHWEEVGSRPLSISSSNIAFDLNTNGTVELAEARLGRLLALRELLRMEFPDRIADVAVNSTLGTVSSSLLSYRIRTRIQIQNRNPLVVPLNDVDIYGADPNVGGLWTTNFQEAECLYLILSSRTDEDGNMLRFFSPTEIGDVDGDGMFEILDQWGQPINFIRWAPGFQSLRQDLSPITSPDPLDPFKADLRWHNASALDDPVALFPLIFSGGPDGSPGIGLKNALVAPLPTPYPAIDDPYSWQTSLGDPVGTIDFSLHGDDLVNHNDIR